MLVLKNDYRLSKSFLNSLSSLIGGEIRTILSQKTTSTEKMSMVYFSDISILIKKKNSFKLLSLKPFFSFSKILNDDISNISMSLIDIAEFPNQPLNFMGFNINIHMSEVYVVERIKIYGEERTSKWSEERKYRFFDSEIGVDVSDYLFNILSISFECENDKSINVTVDKDWFMISFETYKNMEKSFYLKSDIYGDEDLSDEDVWSDLEVIKCHYEINRESIIFFSRMGRSSMWPSDNQ